MMIFKQTYLRPGTMSNLLGIMNDWLNFASLSVYRKIDGKVQPLFFKLTIEKQSNESFSKLAATHNSIRWDVYFDSAVLQVEWII